MKVVLLGDSIRMGYQPFVVNKCTGIEIWGPPENGRHSVWELDHFQEWVVEQTPDLVHVNFGIHDASIEADGEHQILLAQYRLCLQRFIAKIKAFESAKMIWALTTPLYSPDPAKPMEEWRIADNHEIKAYNDAALEIVQNERMPINDLHDVIVRNNFSKCLTEDGCHMTDFGNEVLSDAVVEAIAEHS